MNAAPGRVDGRRSRWAEHNQERRLLILDAAVTVIERSPVDTHIQVEQIARQAGLGRAVLYRHFTDRADLDRAVQTYILDDLLGRLTPQVVLEGTIGQIITRLVSTYVEWADAHPALHEFAVRDSAQVADGSPLQGSMTHVTNSLSGLLVVGAEMLAVELDADDRAAVEPLVAGLVGLAVTGVRVWLGRAERQPDAATLSRLLSDTIWYLIDGHARARGAIIDPAAPIEDVIEAAWMGSRA
ncbi:hypothetical protein ASG90_11330 [Nocardioides sp. Soil797]|nr:hypothetical protein ASG90_11330 [Nocardioides sp. Soil797]